MLSRAGRETGSETSAAMERDVVRGRGERDVGRDVGVSSLKEDV